ncbi:OmpA family protein [Aurantimonas sp. 22II-16-19i]|uniref:OmpA family protein n=1 Tax=Aurantimonas sp. 22II-16-19i TaxID=1317114 RepID=UPI0009F7C079|nr:OmpA family protein [Aurantimonas sp. 22II-16-19i]ORE92784.1 hypothetical protein ATO4_16365 [Aurantimonas sp. 22II-16-19i]
MIRIARTLRRNGGGSRPAAPRIEPHDPGSRARLRLVAGLRASVLGIAFALSGPAVGQAQQLQSVEIDDYLGKPSTSKLGDCLAGQSDDCGPGAGGAARSFSRSELCDLKIADEAACPAKLGKTRSMRTGERSRLLIVEDEAEAAMPLPSIDVEILFASGADVPLDRSSGEIAALAEAVADARFAGSRFVVIGHTDAAGSEAFNQELSTRRAAAVRDRLMGLTGAEEARFIVAGRGESDLKNPADPLAAGNRRVQIVVLK